MTYTEAALIEQPAIKLFAELGWETLNCWQETFGEGGLLGRENRGEVVLFKRLRAALEKLNPACPELAIDEAMTALSRDRSAMSPVAANEEIYLLLKEGYKFITPDEDDDDVTLKIIDWQDAENNNFLLCSQMSITGEIETRRPDLLGFVNGLPLVFVELKASHRRLLSAYTDNLKDYRDTIPHLFCYNQLILLSNGIQSRVGSITSQWEHFAEWKKINSEKEKRKVSLEVVVRGTCEKRRLLDLVENYLFFEKRKEVVKVIARYHQYLGVNEALLGLEFIQQRNGQLGVFWHTQGSGKSFSMLFFCQKAFRKLPGNWTFVVVTDRTDLDEQIHKTFHAAGILQGKTQANSSAELKQLLSEDHRFVFTLIQKFRADKDQVYEELSARDDIIVMTDEAHRSQYDTLAMNMRRALPHAGFIAFTGTPLLSGEEKTREVFGDYVSIYHFADAIDDGATLPLYYENRVPEVNLNRDDLGEAIVEILDQADLSDEQDAKLESEFSRAYHIITREERLETIAKDIVQHYMGREYMGKAMVLSIDKATAIRMYNKVQHEWQRELARLNERLQQATGSRKVALQEQIRHMQTSDMAVVISAGQGDYERLAKLGLDLKVHRMRSKAERLDEKFKDQDDPLRIVFLCSMWMTGFDAPPVSTMYLDKPLKDHTLMQTISRANRVFPGKPAGQIVDYVNIFAPLQKALSLYGGAVNEKVDENKVSEEASEYQINKLANEKRQLLVALKAALDEVHTFLGDREIKLDEIIHSATEDMQKLDLLDTASEILLNPEHNEKFIAFVRQINRIFKAILPDARVYEYVKQRVALNMIYRQMRARSGLPVDDQDVLDVVRRQVNELLDISIETIRIDSHLPEPINIADIDFSALAEILKKISKPKRSEVERLKKIIELRLLAMLAKNAKRKDLQEKFQKLIDDYNLGAYTTENFFEELKNIVTTLDEEEKRGAREGLSEAELAIFDLLCSDVTLTEKERNKVKSIAKELLIKIQDALVIDWRKKQRTKARVNNLIEEILDQLPEKEFTEEIWPKKCKEIYLHIYDKYAGEGNSVYH